MRNAKRVSLNLASHPLRNRRLYFLVLSLMVILLLGLSYLTGNLYLGARSKAKEARASISDIEKSIQVAQRKGKELKLKVEELSKKHRGKVDLVNDIILRKSFSWLKLLGNLETALPDSSYIVSLVPRLLDDSRMEVKFRVISRNLDHLLKLINNLHSLEFNNIRIDNEEINERGWLLSEISLSYERNI
ncbi:MAG: hypothetical protein GTO17_08545 [Candidatus Aminicenantes bacterium]|nr:hypothetical protein [Candidatus Aminicenantes bacterium]